MKKAPAKMKKDPAMKMKKAPAKFNAKLRAAKDAGKLNPEFASVVKMKKTAMKMKKESMAMMKKSAMMMKKAGAMKMKMKKK